MKKTHPLTKALRATFDPGRQRDQEARATAKAREQAKAIAKRLRIEIEPLARPGQPSLGWNVWPPQGAYFTGNTADPFEGDHYCTDWQAVLRNVLAYERLIDQEEARRVVDSLILYRKP